MVQDEGSQLVALALTRVAGRRRRAPLARPVRRARRQVRAAGRARSAWRAARWTPSSPPSTARSWCAGPSTGCRSRCTSRTAATAPLPDGAFDRVLVDAPCTGLGALRRRPEARWRRRPEDVAELTRLQRELLTAALRHVRPGGVVAYVTCSPHLAETVGVVAAATRRRGKPTPAREEIAVEQLDARPYLPGRPRLGPGPVGAAVAAPARHGRDVPGPAAPHPLSRLRHPGRHGRRHRRGVPSRRASDDRSEHPLGGLRAAGRRGRSRRRTPAGTAPTGCTST